VTTFDFSNPLFEAISNNQVVYFYKVSSPADLKFFVSQNLIVNSFTLQLFENEK